MPEYANRDAALRVVRNDGRTVAYFSQREAAQRFASWLNASATDGATFEVRG